MPIGGQTGKNTLKTQKNRNQVIEDTINKQKKQTNNTQKTQKNRNQVIEDTIKNRKKHTWEREFGWHKFANTLRGQFACWEVLANRRRGLRTLGEHLEIRAKDPGSRPHLRLV